MTVDVTTFADAVYNNQIGNIGKMRTKRGVITLSAGATTSGVLLTQSQVGLNEIVAVIQEAAPSSSGSTFTTSVGATGATLTFWNSGVVASGTTGTTVPVLVLGH